MQRAFPQSETRRRCQPRVDRATLSRAILETAFSSGSTTVRLKLCGISGMKAAYALETVNVWFLMYR